MEAEQQPFLQYSEKRRRSSSSEDESDFPERCKTKHRRLILSHILVFVVTSSIWVATYLAVSTSSASKIPSSNADGSHDITSNARLLDCGDSLEEARSLGCEYDVLLNHWVPAPCVDHEFVQEYQDDDSWAAYADEAMTQQLMTVEEMGAMEVYYTSVRDHVNHCAIVWKKQFYMLYEERPAIDSVIVTPYHTDHCAQYLMDVTSREWENSTKVEVGFAGCWLRQ